MIKMTFNKVKVGMGGATEILEFVSLERNVAASRKFLKHTGWTDFITNGYLMRTVIWLGPTLMPNPNVTAVVEKFAAMAGRDRAKKSATDTGFGVN